MKKYHFPLKHQRTINEHEFRWGNQVFLFFSDHSDESNLRFSMNTALSKESRWPAVKWITRLLTTLKIFFLKGTCWMREIGAGKKHSDVYLWNESRHEWQYTNWLWNSRKILTGLCGHLFCHVAKTAYVIFRNRVQCIVCIVHQRDFFLELISWIFFSFESKVYFLYYVLLSGGFD